MTATPKLTIAVPTYSREKEVLALIADLQQLQELEDVAIVIVNDHGNPKTHETVSAIAATSLRNCTILRNEENLGIDKNIDRCYSVAETDYVLVVGDDDRIDVPNAARLVNMLRARDLDLLIVEYSYIRPNGELLKQHVIGALDVNKRDFVYHRATKLGFVGSVVFRAPKYRKMRDGSYLGTYFNHVGVALSMLFDAECRVGFFDRPVVLNRAADMSIATWAAGAVDVIAGWWTMIERWCAASGVMTFSEYKKRKTCVTFQYNDLRWIFSRRADGILAFEHLPRFFAAFPLSSTEKGVYLLASFVPRAVLRLAKEAYFSTLLPTRTKRAVGAT